MAKSFEHLKKRTEADEQYVVGEYLRLKYPNVLWTIAPQGMKLPIGVAVKMKRLGYKSGTPDILIFQPNHKYHGLFIEMKREKTGRLSSAQIDFINKAERLGYKTAVCWGSREAIIAIDNYMSINRNPDCPETDCRFIGQRQNCEHCYVNGGCCTICKM